MAVVEQGADVASEVESSAIAVEVDPAVSEDLDLKLQLARRLAETRVTVDQVLDAIHESRLEARRLVTTELGFDPRPETLHTIVKLADDPSAHRERRELPRHLLTVHALAERELTSLLDAPELDGEAVRVSRENLLELRELSRKIQEEISSVLTPDSQDYLLQASSSLGVADDSASTAILLAPRLELFASVGASGDLRSAIPSLNDNEIRLLRQLIELGPSENSLGRNCLNSIALRSLMAEDVERWEELCAGAHAADGRVVVEPQHLQRMGREKTAFHFISDRFQDAQDSARLAGLDAFAEQLGSYRQTLFATYLTFAPAFRGATLGKTSKKVPSDDAALRELLDRARESDETVDGADATARASASDERRYLKALTGIRRPETPTPSSERAGAEPEASTPRPRLRALVGTAALLCVICVAVFVPFLVPPTRTSDLTPASFASVCALTEVAAAGGVMYARISDWSWGDLTPAERLAVVEQLGQIARTHRLEGILVADEAGHEAARWNSADGAVLVPSDP